VLPPRAALECWTVSGNAVEMAPSATPPLHHTNIYHVQQQPTNDGQARFSDRCLT
jgi:hypothetical protein